MGNLKTLPFGVKGPASESGHSFLINYVITLCFEQVSRSLSPLKIFYDHAVPLSAFFGRLLRHSTVEKILLDSKYY